MSGPELELRIDFTNAAGDLTVDVLTFFYNLPESLRRRDTYLSYVADACSESGEWFEPWEEPVAFLVGFLGDYVGSLSTPHHPGVRGRMEDVFVDKVLVTTRRGSRTSYTDRDWTEADYRTLVGRLPWLAADESAEASRGPFPGQLTLDGQEIP